jgi:hypothetical protein
MADRLDASPSPTALAGLALRTWWMMLGNGILGLVLALMALERGALPSLLDAIFAALVVSLVAARLADIRYFEGRTAEGARATMEHFRRYTVRLLTGSAAGWGLANAVALL